MVSEKRGLGNKNGKLLETRLPPITVNQQKISIFILNFKEYLNMRSKIFIIVIAFWGLFQSSCSNNTDNDSTKAGNELTGNPSPKSFSGIFFGITPCADCPGIETTVHFMEDSIFVENFNYMERNTSFADTGKWSISHKIVTVSFPDHHSYFLVKSDSVVSILDADKKEIEGPLSDKFILKKKNSDQPRIE